MAPQRFFDGGNCHGNCGEVVNLGVYKLLSRSCVEDFMVMYGGFFTNADRS
jgi:hypothetical protein